MNRASVVDLSSAVETRPAGALPAAVPARVTLLRPILILLILGGACLWIYGARAQMGPALADEFIYLAGARHFAETGGLNARYYDADAIIRLGHPHHDVHMPGYVLLLGLLMRLAPYGFATAVGLNVVAYLASGLLVFELTRRLRGDTGLALLAGSCALLLPALLPYVYWAMAELVLIALYLAALASAAWRGDRRSGAVLSALFWGLALLVRESALFGLPALVGLLWRRGRLRTFVLVAALTLVGGYLPLSRGRATGGANFWEPTSGPAFGFQAVQAAKRGRIGTACAWLWARTRDNAGQLIGPGVTVTERGFLLVYLALPVATLARWRRLRPTERRFAAGLLVGWSVMVVVLFAVYVIVQWSGFRYLMLLIPPFLAVALPQGPRSRWAAGGALLLAGAALAWGTLAILNSYKESRQLRQQGILGYVSKYVDRAPSRIALPNGWLYGLQHYPVEVISSVPEAGGQVRVLERAVWFDYLVLPGDSRLAPEIDDRLRYQRLNADDPEPPLFIYRRLK